MCILQLIVICTQDWSSPYSLLEYFILKIKIFALSTNAFIIEFYIMIGTVPHLKVC